MRTCFSMPEMAGTAARAKASSAPATLSARLASVDGTCRMYAATKRVSHVGMGAVRVSHICAH